MIERHFESVRRKIEELDWLIHRTIVESEYDQDSDIGIIGGSLIFRDGSIFHFKEVFIENNRKYRFHFMDSESNLILRRDNAPHHKDLKTFPHHVHLPDSVEENEEIEFSEALHRIEEVIVGKLDES